MPSVDRVGRYFPLTVVQGLGEGPACTQQMQGLWHWLGRLDELARDALFEDWTADQLEQELARMAGHGVEPLPAMTAGPADTLQEVPLAQGQDAGTHIGMEAQRLWAAQARGRAWWHAHPDDAPARLLVSRGLPLAQGMSRMLGLAATI